MKASDTFTKFFTKNNLLITALFVVFLFLRLFVSSDSVIQGGDNLKYLEAAKSFPSHKLYNHQLYLLHPPFYPYTIYFVNLFFQKDYIAAIFISLFSSIVTFFILYKFFMMLTRNFNITFFILMFYTLSVAFIISAGKVLKESFLIMLIFLTIYYYVKGIKFNEKKSLIAASIFGSFLAFTSDHTIFLFPALILSYIFFSKINLKNLTFPNLKYAIIPVIIILIFYGSWFTIKFYQYSNNEYYPNGVGGTPLDTQNLNLLSTISPTYFEGFNPPYFSPGPITVIKRIAFQFGYMFDIEPFSIPQGLNFTTMKFLLFPRHIVYMFLIYLPLALIALLGFFSIIKDFIKTKQIYNNVNLYIVGLFLIFLIPITQTFVSPRHILTSYFFLFYFIGYGLVVLFEKKLKLQVRSKLIPIITILLLLIIPFWYYYNPYLVLFNKPVFGAQDTAEFINSNLKKEDAIMAQAGYAVKLIYLTGHRVVGLYPKPEKLLSVIDYYDIKYVIFGRHYTSDVHHYSIDSVEFVRNNPDKFKLIATIHEDYSDFYTEEDLASTDEVYIYKVKNKI
ncbi:glycosyltransferase family 39 protein [archaeon AH-315-M20]|nr:glycosyltransferase family 39 protein [archaeon AH-315-M20]